MLIHTREKYMLSSGQNTTDSLSVVKVPVGKGKKYLPSSGQSIYSANYQWANIDLRRHSKIRHSLQWAKYY